MSKNGILGELVDILTKGSQILLIKGTPGSGKTTLALTLLDILCKHGACFYFAAREDINKLLSLAPSILERIPHESLIQLKLPKHMPFSNVKERITYLEFEGRHPLFSKIYDITKNQKQSFIVIDSLDAIEEEISDLSITGFIKDLAELGNLNDISFILIRETSKEEKIDYLADVVIYLEKDYLKDRLVRSLVVSKNRFSEIKTTFYTFTLLNRNFYSFDAIKSGLTYLETDLVKNVKPFKIRPHREDAFFTTIDIFDNIILKGIQKGSTLLIGMDSKIPLQTRIIPYMIIGINFLLQDLDVYVIPPVFFSKDTLSQIIAPWVPSEQNVAEFLELRPKLSLKDFLDWNALHVNSKNYLKIIVVATLESYLSEKEIIEYINQTILQTQQAEGLFIIGCNTDSDVYTYVSRMVTHWVEVHNFKFTQILLFNSPQVPTAFLLRPHLDNGYPQLDTIPVL